MYDRKHYVLSGNYPDDCGSLRSGLPDPGMVPGKVGKAMVKGWAVPCRYYPRPWRRGGYCKSFVYPGISDYEMQLVHQIMRGW